MTKVDVVVVGGGLGGLYSAYRLAAVGLSYVVLEATERLGGRILSLPVGDTAPLGVDLGPTWFWPHQRRMHGLLAELGIPWFEQYVEGDALYQMEPGMAPQRFQGAGAMIAYRVRGGFQRLVDGLSASLDPACVRLGHPVTTLEQRGGLWRVGVGDGAGQASFEAAHLVLAAPPRLLLERLPLAPWLPAGVRERLAATPTWMAGQAKFVATYRRPFWRAAGLAGDAFSRVGPLVEIHDASADREAGPALFGFVGLPAAARAGHGEEALKALCLHQLAGLFGAEALKTENTYLKDWARDPWVATPRDGMEPSMHPQLDLGPYRETLATLRLGFAATEAAPMEGGLLEGALLAAEVAVADIMAARGASSIGARELTSGP
ncbi:MAG: FAD-dependent oxidoreductase [Gammaproteobacteria bacterium]|nr:FAD-dependent oxidoreductase [Gammaproteobacteria bacterium]